MTNMFNKKKHEQGKETQPSSRKDGRARESSRLALFTGERRLERDPRMHMTALRNRAKEIRQRSHANTHEYSLESRSAIFPARCFKNRSQSGPVAPEVANTSGQKEPWSTLMMRSSYSNCLDDDDDDDDDRDFIYTRAQK